MHSPSPQDQITFPAPRHNPATGAFFCPIQKLMSTEDSNFVSAFVGYRGIMDTVTTVLLPAYCPSPRQQTHYCGKTAIIAPIMDHPFMTSTKNQVLDPPHPPPPPHPPRPPPPPSP